MRRIPVTAGQDDLLADAWSAANVSDERIGRVRVAVHEAESLRNAAPARSDGP